MLHAMGTTACHESYYTTILRARTHRTQDKASLFQFIAVKEGEHYFLLEYTSGKNE